MCPYSGAVMQFIEVDKMLSKLYGADTKTSNDFYAGGPLGMENFVFHLYTMVM
jgi:hypothetical protein